MAAGLTLALAKGVLGKLGEIATQPALNEASLLLSLNYENDFNWLQMQLSLICHSLQAAEKQSGHTDAVKKWLALVRNIAFDAEDIVDECAVEHLYTNTSQSWFCSYFQLIMSRINQLIFQYQMGKRIKGLKDRISSTIEEARQLKLLHDVVHLNQPSTSTSQSERGAELRRWSILEKDSPAVAVDHKVDEILRLLENPAVGVVAVVGMGGLGKTFLLQHVYNRSKHRYECSAWISVSQTCNLRKLQCDLASHIDLEIDNRISDVRAAELIYGSLEGKNCLIVLDDVWSSSIEGNLISRIGVPTGRNSQCKIVVTTRSKEVTENMSAHVYEMQHLSEVDSRNLFCQFAFRDSDENMPPGRLESLVNQIVTECGRLPLAIKTVAASMAKSSLTSDWESKLEQLKNVGNAEDSITKILKLSYDSLPPHLKSCFAYFSFFPEDTHSSFSYLRIKEALYQDYVIYLWIAEGFIPHDNDKEQWEIGLNYLQQLENLCLLEVHRVLVCYTVHDLLLDLVVNICKDHECAFDLPFKETSCRRLLLAKKGIATNAISERPLYCQRFLHTLSFSQNPDITSIPQHLFDHLRVLRVIDFSHTAISTLPKCVGNLKLLKVLNLSYTQIREVPDCVRRLKSLQFLDVSECPSLQRVPDWIGELKCLSHLNVEWCSEELCSSQMPKGMSRLSNLRTLRSRFFPLYGEENDFLNVKDVGTLTNLQEISFHLKDVRGLRNIEDGILDRLVKMRTLAVSNGIPATGGDTEEYTLPAFPEKMEGLQQLYLKRFSVPSWICGMENLTELSLQECSDYPSLQKMPNLQSLNLLGNSKCTELPKEFGESGGFPKLVRLEIYGFPLLEELPALEEEAMQRLEGLWIYNCPRVKKVPEGLERLSRLKQIELKAASGELEERLEEGGEDWNKIKVNNPHIQINFF